MNMNKKILCAVILSLLSIGAVAQFRINMGEDSPLRKLQIAEMAVTNLYVDSVNEDKLVEDGIRGMLEKLDPHSSYLTAKEVKEANEPLQGNFEGIGVQFNMAEDTLLVIQPVTNGPSEKVGIIAGDRIVKVNDTIIAGVKMPKEEIMKRLRGPKGTKVVLAIVRRGIQDTLTFNVIRDKIPVHTIDAAYMVRPKVGYIRIGSFGAATHDEFVESMNKLTKAGMESLILDLQENGGGYLQTAVKIAEEFLQAGDLIVYTNGRRTQRTEYNAKGGGLFTKGKVIVLVDSYTALPDGSMIRLTIAHYYTPSGRCIQKPYEKGKQKDYAEDMLHRLKSGELMSADSVHFADSLKYYTLKEHRVVYGGGGIMPDEFVPLDTTKYTRFHRELSAKSLVINANLRYVDQHRKQLHRDYKTFDDYRQRFEVPQSVIDGIMAEAEKQNIKPKDDEELQRTLPYLRLQLKALIARDLWEMNEYFTIMGETNDILQRALQLL